MIRLRQVALVARDLDAAVDELCERLGLQVCFRDPGVGAFGLHNALMTIGDQFLEVVAPVQEGTTAGRLLDKRGGDGGYMAIYEVDDLDRREVALAEHGIRIVWSGDLPDIRGRHLHPADVGGAIVSLDQPVPNGAWRWAGPSWVAHADTSVVTGIAGVVIGAKDPAAMRARWRAADVEHAVRFQPSGVRGEGLDELELVATDRRRAGEEMRICGVTVRLV
jgi:catechol 2,3-dioxygenase-like lactoylglutathione lyase family enzyme